MTRKSKRELESAISTLEEELGPSSPTVDVSPERARDVRTVLRWRRERRAHFTNEQIGALLERAYQNGAVVGEIDAGALDAVPADSGMDPEAGR